MIRILSVLCLTLMSLYMHSQDWSKYEITSHFITDQVYMLEGVGGNIGVLLGPEGNIVIDDQFGQMAEKIKTAIGEINNFGVKYIINTHAHRDHTSGNENFAKSGSIIVSQEKVRKRMSSHQFIEFTGDSILPSASIALPVVTFEKTMHLFLNDENVHIFHIHDGHTDGDALVYLENNNVIHMGDTYFAGAYPFIDWSSGGNLDGLLTTLNKVILLINKDTKIIPGHGPLSSKDDLIAYRNNIQETRDIIRESIREGVSMEDFLALDLLKEQNLIWGKGWIDGKDWVTTLYKLYTKE